MTDEEANRAAFNLVSQNGPLIGAVLGHLMQTRISEIMASQPDETQKRELAYHGINAINDIDSRLRNMASEHKASNPA